MSEVVWLSEAMVSSRLDFPMTNDLVAKDRDKVVEAGDIYRNGGSLPPELCPNRIWFKPDRRPMRKLPDLFHPGSYYVVSKRAADILRQFDLGGGALYPVREGIYGKDNKTRIEGEYFTWVFGNVKKGFLEQYSPAARPRGGRRDWCAIPPGMKDDDMAVSREVLEGPDVWVDPVLFRSLFLSGRLADALIKAGLKRAFMLYRCRVI